MMAINHKDYIHKVDVGIKADADFKRFFLTVKSNGKLKRQIVDYSEKRWGKTDRINNVKQEMLNFRNEDNSDITERTTLNVLSEKWFEVQPDTKWIASLKAGYERHIKPEIGSLQLKRVTQNRVDLLKKKLEVDYKGRMVRQVLKQTLIPILEYAKANGVDIIIPTVKNFEPAAKKIVKKPDEVFKNLYSAIMERYKDAPFYRALFLFLLFGRRWGEVKSLEVSDLDMVKLTYTLRAENTKDGKEHTFSIPTALKDALLDLDPDDGLVFPSPYTGKMLSRPLTQLNHLRTDTGIEGLTPHLFRHILVSALADRGVTVEVASDMLGHGDITTTQKYYLSRNKLKSSISGVKSLEEVIG